MSKPVISHVHIPCKEHPGQWHHFIVTVIPGRTRLSDVTRVAYERTLASGAQMTQIVSDEADHAARWNLNPAAASAWVAQRAHGWNGTLASLDLEFFTEVAS